MNLMISKLKIWNPKKKEEVHYYICTSCKNRISGQSPRIILIKGDGSPAKGFYYCEECWKKLYQKLYES